MTMPRETRRMYLDHMSLLMPANAMSSTSIKPRRDRATLVKMVSTMPGDTL